MESQARHPHAAETGFSSYRPMVHFQLLSTLPRGNAVTFNFRVYGLLWSGLAPLWCYALTGVRHRGRCRGDSCTRKLAKVEFKPASFLKVSNSTPLKFGLWALTAVATSLTLHGYPRSLESAPVLVPVNKSRDVVVATAVEARDSDYIEDENFIILV